MIKVIKEGKEHKHKHIKVYQVTCGKCESVMTYSNKDEKCCTDRVNSWCDYYYIKCPICKHRVQTDKNPKAVDEFDVEIEPKPTTLVGWIKYIYTRLFNRKNYYIREENKIRYRKLPESHE